jgi:molybdenum cofactor biosynthesis enzyme MoaA
VSELPSETKFRWFRWSLWMSEGIASNFFWSWIRSRSIERSGCQRTRQISASIPMGGATPSDEFIYNGHRVEIVPPDTLHPSATTGRSRLTASSSAIFCLTQRERRQTKRRSLSSGNRSSLCLTRALRKASPTSHDSRRFPHRRGPRFTNGSSGKPRG